MWLVYLVVDNLDVVALPSEDLRLLLVCFSLSSVSLDPESLLPLSLDALDVIVKVLWNDDVA